jgi:hypothetical protein
VITNSSWLEINCSIVQGSGIGPSLFILIASDSHTLCVTVTPYSSLLMMLVAENYEVALQEEFLHVQQTAKSKKK